MATRNARSRIRGLFSHLVKSTTLVEALFKSREMSTTAAHHRVLNICRSLTHGVVYRFHTINQSLTRGVGSWTSTSAVDARV
jgi:hypothetical protein